MENGNQSQFTEFILLGFSYQPETKMLLFFVLLAVFLVALTANSLFITLTVSHSHLHSPMYFFLCNLSFLDLCYSLVSAPTVLEGLLVQRIHILVSQCIIQMYFALSLGQTECFLLAVIAWDRYIAICNPFHYQQMMTKEVCLKIAISTWTSGFIFSLACLEVLPLTHFCGHRIIDHTYCEAEALGRLTCMDSNISEFLAPMLSLVSLVSPLLLIFFTYFRIISTILRLPTADRKKKTFTTCGSHMVVVVLFYGTAMVLYLTPKSTIPSEKGKTLSVLYCLVVPALNPLIYTLRNKEVKRALLKVYKIHTFC